MTPAIPTLELLLVAFVTGTFGDIILPTDLSQTMLQVSGRNRLGFEEGPGASFQQGLAQVAETQLTAQLAFELTIEALVVVVGAG